MEKAILKTLAYADIFDYPLKIWEIHKWLVVQKTDLTQVEKAIKRLINKDKIQVKNDYVALKGRRGLFKKRLENEKQSISFFKKAKIIAYFLKLIPWLKLVGVSGGLAMENAGKEDDIDLVLITQKNRLWISRLLVLLMLDLMGQRRAANDTDKSSSGKVCPNLLLEEDQLEQQNKDLYTAHEVLQMKVLWQRDKIYFKYLEDNNWAFEFLPNWTTSSLRSASWRSGNLSTVIPDLIGDPIKNLILFKWIPAFAGMTMERLAKRFQLWMMSKPRGQEKIGDHSLYFHPRDYRQEVLVKFNSKLKSL